jgi:predicted outer membrane lipoprotein
MKAQCPIALHCPHEEAGFQAGMSSDHFAPWSERQGESGFAWSFLGAALARNALPFGIVNALSWARTDAEARQIAYDQWRTNVFDPPVCWDLQRHVAWLQDLDAFGEMSSRS